MWLDAQAAIPEGAHLLFDEEARAWSAEMWLRTHRWWAAVMAPAVAAAAGRRRAARRT